MTHNTCITCGANNGRAGMLINDECLNCHDTRKHGAITVHSGLLRKPEELDKTFAILEDKKATTRKLRPLLIDIGHQIESMETPGIDDIRWVFDEFEQAMADDDLVELRKVGTILAAMVGKVVVSRC